MRNYQKEREWEKKTYTELRAKINKELGDQFKQTLKDNNIIFARWLTDRITEYLRKDTD